MSNNKNKILHIVLDKKNLSSQFFKKNINIFTLNKFILSKNERENINHFYPNENQTSKNSEEILLATTKAKKYIIKKLKETKIFNQTKNLDELIGPFLEIKISRFLYLEEIIPNFDYYVLINKNHNKKFSKKIDILLAIDYFYSSNTIKSISYIDRFSTLRNRFYNGVLLKIQRFFLKNLINKTKKEIYLFSDEKVYFLNYLRTKYISEGKFALCYSATSSVLRILKILFKQFVSLIFFKKQNQISFFLLPTNKNYYNKNFLKKFCYKKLDPEYISYLIKQIDANLVNTINFISYFENLLKDLKIEESFFHSLRCSDLFSLSRVMLLNNKKISLISHGTHTYHKNNKLDLISSKEMAIGLAYTKNQRIKLLSQSTFCDDFLNSIKAKYTKINFLIGKEIPSYKKGIYLKKERIQILYIGTIKPLGARRYYYESSAEIIGSILKIYSKLSRYKKYFELIIRIRDVHNEINSDILNNAFGNLNEFITIRKGLNLKQEIDNCDCLISYSSTVLEQGLEQNKPVMCFGLPSYNHFKSYENKNISIDFPCKNKNLKIIEKSLERKFILKSNIYKRHIEYFF